MERAMTGRRAALDGLARILDAGAPEELFTGPEREAHSLYGLLVDTARARASAHYWEICRTARRRGVTPEYVVDRAAVLLATIKERRRTDLYRILGVPPLSSGETIREHWLELAKQHHPDAGGDGARFRQAQQAYEILRDPTRRAEYERFWLRALGPFERVAPREDLPPLEVMAATARAARHRVVEGPPPPAAPVPVREMMIGDRDLDHALERLPLRAGRRPPHRLEHLVHLEEEPLVPERGGDPAGAYDAGAGRAASKRGGGSQRAPRVRGHRRRVRRMHGEEGAPARIDQMHGREARRGCGRRRVGGRGEPAERGGSRVVLAGGEPQLRERVAQRERKPGRGHARLSPVLGVPGVLPGRRRESCLHRARHRPPR